MRNRNIAIMLIAGFLATASGDVCVQSEEDLNRAGCPHQISPLARVGYGKRYVVYYVGGGAPTRRGDAPRCDEGTFGVDYKPIVPGFKNSVALGWWHGRRIQGGSGQYQQGGTVPPLPNRALRVSERRESVE